MNKKKVFILLFIIVIIASFLRLWRLGEVPSSPDWDEASLGYNAYSIMQTGKDEYGKFLPVVLRSFDDYKPALYTYFIIPFIKLFGLGIVSVRLPSAIFGILTVVATYFLVKNLFELNSKDKKSIYIALAASFLLAISPWSIQFSRIAFESNAGTAFNVFSILFLLISLKKPRFLILAAILAGANFHIYQSEKVFTPLLVFAFILIFRKEFFSLPRKYIISALILGFIVLLPMISYIFTNKEALARAQGVSVFSDQTPFLKDNVLRLQYDRQNNDYLGLILDNRRMLYVKSIINGYLSHFDLNWLFINGDIARHHAPGMGLLYLFELPFLLIGVYSLIFGNFDKKIKYLIFSWILITPIPASITSGVPHAVRTLNFIPVLQIITALGIITFLIKVSSIKYQVLSIKIKYLIFSFSFILFAFNVLYYLNQYFVQYNYFNSQDWQYGYKDAVLEVKNIESKYDRVVVTNKPYLDQSYMFFLFYLQYPPKIYQEEAVYASGGFRENHAYGKYEFRQIEWNREQEKSKTLYIGMPGEFPANVKTVKEIYFLDGKPAIKIVEG